MDSHLGILDGFENEGISHLEVNVPQLPGIRGLDEGDEAVYEATPLCYADCVNKIKMVMRIIMIIIIYT